MKYIAIIFTKITIYCNILYKNIYWSYKRFALKKIQYKFQYNQHTGILI